MHIEDRNGASIDRIYLHKNEGPEVEGGAVGLGKYLDTIDGGYHKIVDDKVTVTKANDNQVVWAEGGDNTHCLSICLVGWSAETTQQYGSDAYSQAEIERAAQEVAMWCKAYNIPPGHLPKAPAGKAPTGRGICEHADDQSPLSEGHTDPGPDFDIHKFCQRVSDIIVGEVNLAHFYLFCKEVTETPLKEGDSSWLVTSLKQMLNKIGEGPGNDHPYFGSNLAKCVVKFKEKHGVPSTSPEFGGVALAALLKLI